MSSYENGYGNGYYENEQRGQHNGYGRKRRRRNHGGYIFRKIGMLFLLLIILVIAWRMYRSDGLGDIPGRLNGLISTVKGFGSEVSGSSDSYRSGRKEADTSGKWNLILVNDHNHIPDNYKVKLITLSNGKKVDKRIYPELQKMFNAARANGMALFVREGYRTRDDQKKIMDEKIQKYKNQGYSENTARKKAEDYVAVPGTSEHELGLSVDINAETDRCSADAVYQWLATHAYQYGFVKRYPSDKTKITGISNEPWHYRYVGRKAAKVMREENLCLEEYLKKYSND